MGHWRDGNQISTRELVNGYQDWVMEYVDQEWLPYEMSLMFNPLSGSKSTQLEQMKTEIYRANSRLVTRFDRNPRSLAGFNRLPQNDVISGPACLQA